MYVTIVLKEYWYCIKTTAIHCFVCCLRIEGVLVFRKIMEGVLVFSKTTTGVQSRLARPDSPITAAVLIWILI